VNTKSKILRIAAFLALILLVAGCEILIVSSGNGDDDSGPIFLDSRNTTVSDSGSVSAKDDVDYEVWVTNGVLYDVTLTGLNADADLYVYEDAGFSTESASSDNINTLDESLTTSVSSGERLYIRVRNVASSATAYTLIVSEQ
jgi:hypothetical protein